MNLVLSGGGMKGILYVSLIKILEEKNLIKSIKNYAGTSIGGFFCLLILLEYEHKEIYNLFINNNIKNFFKSNLLNIFRTYNIIDITLFYKLIEVILNRKLGKKYISFIELYNLTNKDLNIVSTNISTGKEKIFNKINTPNVNIVDSIVSSCIIPILVYPIKIEGEYYIDGFFKNNFPINIFKKDLKNTIGIKVIDFNLENYKYKEYNLKSLIINMYNILLPKDNPKLNKELKLFVTLDTNINPLEFELLRKIKIKEVNRSYNLLKKKFKYEI